MSEPIELCDDHLSSEFGGPEHWCTKQLGHRGWHQQDDGVKWRNQPQDGPPVTTPDPALARPPAAEARMLASLADHLDWSAKNASSYPALEAAAQYVARELRAISAPQPPPSAPDTAAEVLAGLVEEMRAVNARVVETMQFGLKDIDPYCGRPDDEERWMERVKDWADWTHGEYVALVEAAQQRLDGERGQGRG